jgi:ATP/maltotriose-dependent transcriptional regulator MalT
LTGTLNSLIGAVGSPAGLALGTGKTVGRADELERLEGALDALDRGEPGCLAVEGEPGIGKTRLLDELRERAEARGHLTLAGAAAEFERDLPFAVWADALDAYVAAQDPGGADDWGTVPLDELADVLPSVRPNGRAAGSGLADERYRAHRAVRSLLERLSDPNSLVLVLDDLHWADTASLELLAAILKRGPGAPVLLACAFRTGQVPPRLAAALAAPSLERIALGQLTQGQAEELLTDLDPGSVAEVYSRGGGNPFYLEQLARASEAGRLGDRHADGAADEAGVPPAVAAALTEELEGLGPGVRAFLDAAAVAGEPFEPDLAAAIAELAPAAGLAALDELLSVDLVRPTQVPRRFVFRHPLVRRTVYASTRGGWRLAAHARAAAALEERGAAAGERAHHVEQAAAQGDGAAVHVLVAAGEESAGRAPAAAARWYEAALRLLPAADLERRADLHVALASAQRALGELDLSRSTLLDAMELLPDDAVARRVRLTALCAAVEHWLGRHEDAHRRLARAWEDLPDRDTEEAAALQVELAVDGLYSLDFDRTCEMGCAALDTARRLGDRPLIASAAAALALGEASGGRIDAAREHRAQALEQVERLSDAELAGQLEALYYLGWADNYLEHFDAALEHADRGIELARATGEGRLLVPLMLVKPYALEMHGDMDGALELCERAVESARVSANPHFLFWALFELGWAHYYRGDLDAAVAACEESRRVGGRLAGGTMPAASGGPGWPLAATQFELGRVEDFFETMAAIGGVDLAHAIPVERCFYWETLTLAELARGRPDAAEAHAAMSEEHAARLGLMLPLTVSARGRAAVLLAAGKPADAAEKAAEAAEAAGAVGAALPAAYARALQGRALAAAGERAQAVAALRAAESALDRSSSMRVRDEVRRELRKLGARAEKRGPAAAGEAGLAALTKRELEIAGLITDRKTNREIAGELFLSEKTIESHVRNLFVKLGVSSRVDVARAVERERRGSAAPGAA